MPRPMGTGRATRLSDGDIIATFPLSEEMAGFRFQSADVDPSGYFLIIRFTPTTEERL